MLTAISQIELCEQCRKLKVAKHEVTVLITKSREEIELSAAKNYFLCHMLRRQYESADLFGGRDPFNIRSIGHFETGSMVVNGL